jgi:hypothetical protein
MAAPAKTEPSPSSVPGILSPGKTSAPSGRTGGLTVCETIPSEPATLRYMKNFNSEFWVLTGTTAPVIALACIVLLGDLLNVTRGYF